MQRETRAENSGGRAGETVRAPTVEGFLELSILRTTGNVRIVLLILLLVVALSSPIYVVSRLAVYISLVIGVLLTLWTRFAAQWAALRAAGQMKTAAGVVLLGEFVWLTLFVYGTGGLNSPFSALLLIPVLFASAFFSLLRLAAALATGLIVVAMALFAFTGQQGPEVPWQLTGMIFAIIAIAWVSYGLSLVLERERYTNELVVHHLSEAVVLVDGLGVIRLVNDPLERFTNMSVADMMRLNVGELADRPGREALAEILHDIVDPAERTISHVRDMTLDTPEPVDLRVTTISLGGRISRPTGWLVVCQDVTELKSLVRVRESGIRFLSHEMRSPLTTFKLISSVFSELAGRLDDNRSAKLIEIVDSETDRMLRLVGTFLDVAALDESSYRLNVEEFDIAEMVAKVGDALEVRATQKGVSVSTHCAQGLPAIQADPDGIEGVLFNLTDNALKYTDAGGEIATDVNLQDGFVTITISDTGCGIPADKHDIIFDEFAQAHESAEGNPLDRGIGLGLYMVRRMVELHGGRIELESEVGQGSTFTIYLPVTQDGVRRGEAAPEQPAPA